VRVTDGEYVKPHERHADSIKFTVAMSSALPASSQISLPRWPQARYSAPVSQVNVDAL
jgi:hypothetical protein